MARHSGQHSLVIASNRLPIRLTISGDEIEVTRSSGGLATALQAVRGDATWIGWPGTVVPPALEKRVAQRLARSNLHPVLLTPDEEEGFYNKVCNDTLWPLFHYFSDKLRITPEAWQRYVEVNERFAETILAHCEPESRVWIHDFHLMLVPAMLRRREPRLSIGFFLHTPFPSSEVYRLLPAREQLLRGVLGADYVSFQIGDYARHFRSSCLRILGIDSEPDWLEIDGRRVGHRSRSDRDRRRGLPRDARGTPRRHGSSPSSRASTRGAASCSASSGSTTRRGSRTSSTPTSASSSATRVVRGRPR